MSDKILSKLPLNHFYMSKVNLIIPGSIWRHKRWHNKIKVVGVTGTQIFFHQDSGRSCETNALDFLSRYEPA